MVLHLWFKDLKPGDHNTPVFTLCSKVVTENFVGTMQKVTCTKCKIAYDKFLKNRQV